MIRHTRFKSQKFIQAHLFPHKGHIAICGRYCFCDLSQGRKSITISRTVIILTKCSCHSAVACFICKPDTSQYPLGLSAEGDLNLWFAYVCACSQLFACLWLPQAVGFPNCDTCSQLESVKLYTQFFKAVQWKHSASLVQTVFECTENSVSFRLQEFYLWKRVWCQVAKYSNFVTIVGCNFGL